MGLMTTKTLRLFFVRGDGVNLSVLPARLSQLLRPRKPRFLPAAASGAFNRRSKEQACSKRWLVIPANRANLTYELVASEKTGYRESIQISYDPAKISYDQLLDIYWRQIDPMQAAGQFTDIGPSYRAATFYGNDEEKKIAETSKAKLAGSGKFDKPIVTEILPAMKFYPAEAYHQKYYRQNPAHFEAFEKGSGRVSFQKKTWGETMTLVSRSFDMFQRKCTAANSSKLASQAGASISPSH